MSFAAEKATPLLDEGRKAGRSAFLPRFIGGVAVLAILPLAIWWAGRSGLVSLLTIYAAKTNQVAAADAALRLSPNDPDAHLVRGAILEANSVSAAVEEYKQAARVRPEDYLLWLSLARAQELNGDVGGAIAAASQGVRLAPYYARPHWLLGNILVRSGQAAEGFSELRLAGESDTGLLPAIIDLEWQLSGGDAEFVKRAIHPDSPESFKALADYFRKHGKANDAIEMFRAAATTAEQERRQYLQELISAKSFKEAALLWSIDHAPPGIGQLNDPGFERPSNLDKPGFGWRRDNKAESLTLSLETNNPREGRFSLRVDFNGVSDPGAAIISQLILVEPRAHYELRFAARTEGIVSGGLPYVVVFDAGSNNVLGQTSAFTEAKTNWQDYVIDFQVGENTSTVQLALRRQPCSSSSCPVFGHLWLDNVSLQKL